MGGDEPQRGYMSIWVCEENLGGAVVKFTLPPGKQWESVYPWEMKTAEDIVIDIDISYGYLYYLWLKSAKRW